MSRKEELLKVFKHQNIGYVPNFFVDFNFAIPAIINERPTSAHFEGEASADRNNNEGSGFDWFGVYWKFVPEVNASVDVQDPKVVTDISRWRDQVKFPDLSKYDFEAAAREDTKNWDRENKISNVMLINGPFERSHMLMGFEDTYFAMNDEPEEYQALIDAITDYKIEIIKIIGRYWKPELLSFHDDYGANDRMLMSPDTWRRFFKEPLRRIIQATHEAGMLYEHHSCGYIEPIFEELADLGIDAIDPLQITNPCRELKDKFQHRVTFCGGYDTQNVFDKVGVTEDEIRQEVKRTLNELAPGGSFVAFPLTITKGFAPYFIDEHRKLAYDYPDSI